MGQGNGYHCTKCDFSFEAHLEVGFAFPTVYKEIIDSARKGELGDKLQQFVLNHPEGVVNCENSIIRCSKCGDLVCGPNLNMYLPKEGYDPTSIQHGQWSVAMPCEGADYVTPWDLHEHYKLTAKYPHRCEKCGSSAHVISEKTLARKITEGAIVCPCCGGSIAVDEGVIMWD